MSVCTRVLSVGFGFGLDSMSCARCWRSASHAAGSHDWLPKKTGGTGLRRGRIRWIQFAQSLLPVAHQPRAVCIRLVPIVVLVGFIQNAAEYRQIKNWACSSCSFPPTPPIPKPLPSPFWCRVSHACQRCLITSLITSCYYLDTRNFE